MHCLQYGPPLQVHGDATTAAADQAELRAAGQGRQLQRETGIAVGRALLGVGMPHRPGVL